MTEVPPAEEMCHCGQPLHYTDPVAEAFTRQMIERTGPTVKVQVPVDGQTRVWEVQRHYIALHGLKAVDLPTLGFPEVPSDALEPDVGVSIGPEGSLEPVPGPQEPPYDDEALLAADEPLMTSYATTAAPLPPPGPPASPMRSKAGPVFGKRVCKICLEEVPANNYGEHVIGHGMERVVTQWEGGAEGFMKDLQAALSQSMEEAEGFPEVQDGIAASQRLITVLTKALMASKRDTN